MTSACTIVVPSSRRLRRASSTALFADSTAVTVQPRVGEHAREQADAAEQIERGRRVAELVGRGRDERGELVHPVGAALEERRGRDAPPASGRELVDVVAAHVVGEHDVAPARVGRREALTRTAPAAQQHLVRTRVPRLGHQRHEQRVHDEAAVDRERVVRAGAAEAGAPLRHVGADRRAVRPRRQLDRRLQHSVGELDLRDARRARRARCRASTCAARRRRCAATGTRRTRGRAPGTAARPGRATARARRGAARVR